MEVRFASLVKRRALARNLANLMEGLGKPRPSYFRSEGKPFHCQIRDVLTDRQRGSGRW